MRYVTVFVRGNLNHAPQGASMKCYIPNTLFMFSKMKWSVSIFCYQLIISGVASNGSLCYACVFPFRSAIIEDSSTLHGMNRRSAREYPPVASPPLQLKESVASSIGMESRHGKELYFLNYCSLILPNMGTNIFS